MVMLKPSVTVLPHWSRAVTRTAVVPVTAVPENVRFSGLKCSHDAASQYARIFDLPVGYYGVVYYLYMFGLAALLAYDPLARGLRIGAVLYAALGVLFSLYFMVLQFGYIHAFCIYCLISAVTTVLLAVAAV